MLFLLYKVKPNLVFIKIIIMKNFLIGCFLAFSFISCDLDGEKVEDLVANSIDVHQDVEENFVLPAILLVGDQDPITVPVDTNALLDQIKDVEGGGIDSALIEDTKLVIANGEDDNANFDFLEELSIVISSGTFTGTTLASVGDIPEGATELDLILADFDDNFDLVKLIESGDFDLEVQYSADEILAEPLNIDLISSFLVGVDLDLGL